MKTESFRKGIVKLCYEPKPKSGIFLLEIDLGKRTKVVPGQFISLKPLNPASVMPRPFSVYKNEGSAVSVLFQVVGPNTSLYSKLKKGDSINVIGPMGRPISINKKAKRYILVGGGIGTAALLLLSKRLKELKIPATALLGFKNLSQMVTNGEFAVNDCQVKVITEKAGLNIAMFKENGLVTDLLEEELREDKGKSVVVACGPNPMLKAVHEMCLKYGNECQVMLEEVMACSSGSCKGCAIFLDEKTVKHVCSDGPAFNSSLLDWSRLIQPPVISLSSQRPRTSNPMETILVGNGKKLVLNYPFLPASGTLGIDALERNPSIAEKMGALVTKGVTKLSRAGNQKPRVCETPSGMLNSIGLENVGIKIFTKEELPRWLQFGLPVIVNVSGSTLEEYVDNSMILVDAGVTILEINISCPNVKEGGMAFGAYPETAYKVIGKVCQAVPQAFIIVKLTPNVTDIVPVTKAVRDAGADAVSLINTLSGMAIDVETRRPRLGNILGGLSGPAIRPVAVKMVWQVVKANLGIPTIGIGGIDSYGASLEFIIAGAQAVGVGTSSFAKRNIVSEIHDGIIDYMKRKGINRIQDLVGSLVTN
ncbi:dihydroorotate dehydrogenase B catalytic subunit [Candidatus Falkowbacteria bacterium CG11_big_fil_rev_8_21_14_0_20_39_10]|uniref:Dihydroorotate dehydrogenase n=1 Tax=Candidatus Falkowbacteria bacterium CG11_big_fil_rev_8_21_14_0_20_39_10 TaxID=1974570 RepID=A0A2M6K7W0_9BACT|nr:MAG: dihydroorotate dehydrogenase B catalytic subunit [Candidatus Falkowbacteria bacterium CG11_big_fil_rev_8_21_14_0_20_39_10]